MKPQEEEIRRLSRELEAVRQKRDILKNGGHLHKVPKAVPKRFISKNHTQWSLVKMSRVLEVSWNGFYPWNRRLPIGCDWRRGNWILKQTTTEPLGGSLF